MKLLSMAVCKPNGDKPLLLAQALDLSSFGYFQKNSVKEFATFITRTVAQRTQTGTRQSITHKEWVVHSYARHDGLVGCVIADQEYPSRVAFSLIAKFLDEFSDKYQATWTSAVTDLSMPLPELDTSLQKYQNPAEADQITRLQSDLDEVKETVMQTMDALLERGQKLDTLVSKSEDLSMQSKVFYKTAKKQNQCCSMM
eukprot:TRINITY_DN15499_c0_g1_i2.p1 TRINITY_DN15499_c0_g1~~TRINITY_DN15499_c0_g1_i2.p1  ORF type:complete len:199 (+),score=42.82 TRINITY_DN15499_c0_g1_i2:218-814(+)